MNDQQLMDIKIGDVLGVVDVDYDEVPALVVVVDLYEATSDYYLSEWEVIGYDENPDDRYWVEASCIRYNTKDQLDDMLTL